LNSIHEKYRAGFARISHSMKGDTLTATVVDGAQAAAVARLHAAGDDEEALVEAIATAAFLDSAPGDARQKLRGERLSSLASGLKTVPHISELLSHSWHSPRTNYKLRVIAQGRAHGCAVYGKSARRARRAQADRRMPSHSTLPMSLRTW
jgi:hypothetical protein